MATAGAVRPQMPVVKLVVVVATTTANVIITLMRQHARRVGMEPSNLTTAMPQVRLLIRHVTPVSGNREQVSLYVDLY